MKSLRFAVHSVCGQLPMPGGFLDVRERVCGLTFFSSREPEEE